MWHICVTVLLNAFNCHLHCSLLGQESSEQGVIVNVKRDTNCDMSVKCICKGSLGINFICGIAIIYFLCKSFLYDAVLLSQKLICVFLKNVSNCWEYYRCSPFAPLHPPPPVTYPRASSIICVHWLWIYAYRFFDLSISTFPSTFLLRSISLFHLCDPILLVRFCLLDAT